MDINTYNESSLHKTLKTLYASENGFQTEVKKDGYIYDILDADGNAIEIQTKNLSKLLPKIKKTIKRGKKITVVHPLAVQKTITLTDTEGKIIAKRKSPKKESIYSLFRELTGLHPVLLDEHFSLEVLLVTITEKRMRTDTDVQSKNGRRRFKKNWLKTDNEPPEFYCKITCRRTTPSKRPSFQCKYIRTSCYLGTCKNEAYRTYRTSGKKQAVQNQR